MGQEDPAKMVGNIKGKDSIHADPRLASTHRNLFQFSPLHGLMPLVSQYPAWVRRRFESHGCSSGLADQKGSMH
jgi:gamma-glutamyl:cysteine ligase YbdK (ATP-grasp superfamily)